MERLQSFPTRSTLILILLCAALVLAAPAQTFTKLADFDQANGYQPSTPLVQGTDGNLYGISYYGGTHKANCAVGCGTAFRVAPAGGITSIHVFCSSGTCIDGYYPTSLILGNNGRLHGTTWGISQGCGSVFAMKNGGRLNTLYSFCLQGESPALMEPLSMIQSEYGGFFGTALDSNDRPMIFRILPPFTSVSTVATLATSCPFSGCDDSFGLFEADNANFYGTNTNGNQTGSVYTSTRDGAVKTLHTFCSQPSCTDGIKPSETVVRAADGNLYGTTIGGGTHSAGTVFKIAPGGKLTTLYNFCSLSNCTDGVWPYAGLIQATDGNFYGTTADGGVFGHGSVFQITPAGTLTTLHSFNSTDGATPQALLLQATDGSLYGTTGYGGAYITRCSSGCGTVFRMDVGLGPFVQPVGTGGQVGTGILILGNKLTGSTSVTFNGTAATFSVVSDTEITATVPAGATTGTIHVVTPSTTLSSNVAFRVLP